METDNRFPRKEGICLSNITREGYLGGSKPTTDLNEKGGLLSTSIKREGLDLGVKLAVAQGQRVGGGGVHQHLEQRRKNKALVCR